jgi:hypothetical protein
MNALVALKPWISEGSFHVTSVDETETVGAPDSGFATSTLFEVPEEERPDPFVAVTVKEPSNTSPAPLKSRFVVRYVCRLEISITHVVPDKEAHVYV